MNSHIQLNKAGEFLRYIPAGIPIEWDENNYCTAFALDTDGKSEDFYVHQFYATAEPEHNKLTHYIREVPPVLTERGHYEQQWEIIPLSAEQIENNLKVAKETAWNSIKQERDRRKYLGVKVGNHWFHSDDSSRIQQLALVIMGVNIPAGTMWKTLTLSSPSVFVEMTPTLALGIFQATAANDAAVFAAAEIHRIAMEASSNPQVYDFSSGWPLSVEEE